MRVTARRINGGQPLREAMEAAGLSLKGLMRATQQADESGRGVSWQLLAFLATAQDYARETTTVRTAELIEDALSAPRGTLFTRESKDESGPEPAFETL